MRNSTLPTSPSPEKSPACAVPAAGIKEIIPFVRALNPDAEYRAHCDLSQFMRQHVGLSPLAIASKYVKMFNDVYSDPFGEMYPSSDEPDLVPAVLRNDAEDVRMLLNAGADVHEADNSGRNALHAAAAAGRTEIAGILLDAGADVNGRDKSGWSPLMLAFSNNHTETAEFLLKSGASADCKGDLLPAYAKGGQLAEVRRLLDEGVDVNTRYNGYDTALQYALDNRHEEMIKLLLERGAELPDSLIFAIGDGCESILKLLLSGYVDVTSPSAESLLTRALFLRHRESIKLLVEKGVNVNAKRSGRDTMYQYMLSQRIIDDDLIKLMLDRGADVNARDNRGRTILEIAIRMLDEELMQHLVNVGADLTLKNEEGKTPLLQAIYTGSARCVDLLLKAGSDVNAVDKRGKTALLEAAEHGYIAIIRLLMKAGADINNNKDREGGTALHRAAKKGHTELVKLLLEAGANVNTEDRQGSTPLSFAAAKGNTEIVEILLKAGAGNGADTEEKDSLLLDAVDRGESDIVRLLLKAGANINTKDRQGRTALFVATCKKQAGIVKMLLTEGAEVNAKDKRGRTALDAARNVPIIHLLKAAGGKGGREC